MINMLKKIPFGLIILLIFIVAAGYEFSRPSKPKSKDEARNFNQVYYLDGYDALTKDFGKTAEKSFVKYGISEKAVEELVRAGYSKKYAELREKISQAEIGHEKTRPLKEHLLEAVDAHLELLEYARDKNIQGMSVALKKISQAEDDYKLTYYIIINVRPPAKDSREELDDYIRHIRITGARL